MSRPLARPVLLLLALLLVACAVPEPADPLPGWPDRAPDVVIIGFAGRCNVLEGCSAPEHNRAYLSEAPDPGTLGALQRAFTELGVSSEAFSFRSHFRDSDLGPGYLTAAATLERVKDEWIDGHDEPTRVVLVAHSHGNQFMSLLAWDHPEVSFDYAIYLDAICWLWDSDHSEWLEELYGARANFPAPLDKSGSACDSLPVPGVGDEDISDVVPWNVRLGIEVRSNGMFLPGLLADDDPNHRPDGSSGPAAGLAGLQQTDEGHRQIHVDGSAALDWVLQVIAQNGLPATPAQLQPGAVMVPLLVPDAPAGFDLQR